MARDEKRRQKQLAKKAAKRKTKLLGRHHEPLARVSRPAARIVSYEISDEPMPEPAYARLPAPVKDQLETLYTEMLLQQPQDALAVLKPLIAQYPDVPKLYNYLHIAYRQLDDQTNAQRVLQETLERFPDYLFGRIAYATDCLQRGEAEKVPAIFDNHYDLQGLYPARERFHISEVLGFCAAMAWYFHSRGEPERAETYYALMRQLDPEHRNTRFIEGLLHPSRLDTLLRRLVAKEP
jgi:tetratricopeptide (TPR) repeat protein